MINGHGDDLYKYNGIVANFSSNVYNEVDHSLLWEHLRGRMECMVSYPEPQPYTLEAAIAVGNGVEACNVCVTNGATEAIYLAAQRYAGVRSAIFVPTFSEYEDACRVHGHKTVYATSLDEVEQLCLGGKVDMVWVCNPNNPTGLAVEKQRLERIIGENRSVLFVVDQSYGFFTCRQVLGVKECAALPNVVLLHSMTKRYAVPGVRLGYMTACRELLDGIRGVRMPWSVNAFAIETGLFLLGNDISGSTNINLLLETSRVLAGRIAAIGSAAGPFFAVSESDTHYMLVEILRPLDYGGGKLSGRASDLKEHLACKKGILIRDASNFATLGEGHFRIATQTAAQNDLLIKALEELCM